MVAKLAKSWFTYIILGLYLAIVIWWVQIYASGARDTTSNFTFGFFYAFIALFGSLYGLWISRGWGGFKSTIGRGIIFFSLGLLGEWFGQTVWSYYNLVAHVAVPYPSIGDIGYFAIIPLYALGMLSFAKAAGAQFSLKTIEGKIYVLIIPILMVVVSYFLFLKNVSPDFQNPFKTILDFGYPFGEAITISIALATFALSRGILGGKMHSRILYLIFALTVQWLTDYIFLFKVGNETYYNAGPVDLMYATSFAIMSLGLISLGVHNLRDDS